MPRNIVVKLSDGREQPYVNVPDDVTDEQVKQRAQADYSGLKVVSLTSDAEPAAVSEPSEAAPEKPQGPRSPDFERDLAAYYKSVGEGKEPFDPTRLEGLGKKYNLRIGNVPEVQKTWEERRSLNPVPSYLSTVQTSEQIEQPKPATPEDIIRTGGAGGNWANRARAIGAGALFNFADELEAAFRSGEIGTDDYYRMKNQINDEYQNWAKANPNEALAYEVGGGLSTAFVPAAWLGRAAMLTRGVGALNRGRGAMGVGKEALLSGALTGAVAGAGEAETLSDIPFEAIKGGAFGAGTGLVFGKGAEYLGKGTAAGSDWLRSAVNRYTAPLQQVGPNAGPLERGMARVAQAIEPPAAQSTRAERIAAKTLEESAQAGGADVEAAVQNALLAQKYGLPGTLAMASPEMAALAKIAIAKPSGGQRGLLNTILEQQRAAKGRVRELLDKGFGSPTEYYATEDALTEKLRSNAKTMYQEAYSFGEVRDPEIMRILKKPMFAKYLKEAADLADLDDAPLRTVMEPILNNAGDVIGRRVTDQTIPDVQTLDYVKQALDDEIVALYKAGSGRKAEALKKNRNALLERLDNIVPEFKAARAQYKGDIEVREALQDGLVYNKMNPKQIAKKWADMSDAEQEAFRTGVLQAFFNPIDAATKKRNFAENILSNKNLEVLENILPPAQFDFVKTGLELERDTFTRASQAYGGSQTVPLAQATAQIDDMIAEGQIDNVVDFVMAGPAGRVAAFTRALTKMMPGKQLSDDVWTQMSKALKAQNPDELRAVLDMVQRTKAATDRALGIERFARGPVAAAGGNVGDVYFEDRPAAIPPAPVAESGPTREQLQEQFYQAADTPYTVEGTAIGEPEEAAEDGQAPFDPFTFKAGAVTSGRRTPEGNVAVGGVPTSKHVTGGGIDYVPAQGQSMADLARQAKKHFGNAAKVINEGDHIHVEVHGFTGMPYYGKRGTKGK